MISLALALGGEVAEVFLQVSSFLLQLYHNLLQVSKLLARLPNTYNIAALTGMLAHSWNMWLPELWLTPRHAEGQEGL